MDERAYFDRLDSTADEPADLFEHFQQRSAAGYTHHVLPDARHGLERGTVIVEDVDAVVRGYPSVPRVLVLDTGIRSFFEHEGTVVIEEKLDGYNVRIVDIGSLFAFTRSGYVCPYTTARARELLDPADFFADHPEMMLCAEFVGPETPYTTHDYDEIDSHAFRVFDVRDRESGAPIPASDRRRICTEYEFTPPRCFGQCAPDEVPERAREAIADLDAAGREGIVMKSADGAAMVKYTTESQHHDDLAHAFSLPFDHGREFVFSRIIRDAFQAVEFDEDDERLRERARDLGESILLPMVETVRDVDAGETVGERHTVRGEPRHVSALLSHLRDQSISIDIEDDRRENGDRVVEFVKVAESTNDRVQYYLEGGTRDE